MLLLLGLRDGVFGLVCVEGSASVEQSQPADGWFWIFIGLSVWMNSILHAFVILYVCLEYIYNMCGFFKTFCVCLKLKIHIEMELYCMGNKHYLCVCWMLTKCFMH